MVNRGKPYIKTGVTQLDTKMDKQLFKILGGALVDETHTPVLLLVCFLSVNVSS